MQGQLIDAAAAAVRGATRDNGPADFAIGVRLKEEKFGFRATASVKGKGVTLAVEEVGTDAPRAVDKLLERLDAARTLVNGEDTGAGE